MIIFFKQRGVWALTPRIHKYNYTLSYLYMTNFNKHLMILFKLFNRTITTTEAIKTVPTFNPFTPRPAKTDPFAILLSVTQDNFTR